MHLLGVSDLRQQIARDIAADAARTPSIPESFGPAPAERTYVTHRLRELFAIWRSHGLEPDSVTVTANQALLDAVGPLSSFDSVPVYLYPEHDYSDEASDSVDDPSRGTFVVDIDAFHPASAFVPLAVGIAYPYPVDPAHLATRWVLQELDGMAPSDAELASVRL